MMLLRAYFSIILVAILFPFTYSTIDSNTQEQNFLQCLYTYSNNSNSISKLVYTKTNSSYSSILQFSIQNLRFASNKTPKPLVIITPKQISQIQTTIICSQKHTLQIRIRSGGHDFEGRSYVSEVPFIILDLINFRDIEVNVKNKTAWVQSGATLGELYYAISRKSRNLGFPAGACPTVGVGGHFSGGGWGNMVRKFGLSADNVIDARIIDVKGRFLDKEAMGEDLFWAIRGGGGASFGVIISWKIKLVHVPSIVTVFNVQKTLEQNATNLVHKWQIVQNKIDENIIINLILQKVDSKVLALFQALFLGGKDKFIYFMEENFQELGLLREDFIEMSWIESILYLSGFSKDESHEVLLNRTQATKNIFKVKSDFVKIPISKIGLEGIFHMLHEDCAKDALVYFFPYGGIMDNISESEIPFPHRNGNLYQLLYSIQWDQESDVVEKMKINWITKLYSYMEPFVSKSPRAQYINYRDLDIGVNNVYGYISYKEASIWGIKYFKDNFKRLVKVKTKVDPLNFFRNEQSIPSLVANGWKRNVLEKQSS